MHAYIEHFAEELLFALMRSTEVYARIAALGHKIIRLHTFEKRDPETNAPPGEVASVVARSTVAVSPQSENYPQVEAPNSLKSFGEYFRRSNITL